MRCGYAYWTEPQFSGGRFLLTKELSVFDISFQFLLEAVPSYTASVLPE
jgi:hypothetical protein